MKKMRQLLSLVLVLVMVLSLAGCGSKKEDSGETKKAEATETK